MLKILIKDSLSKAQYNIERSLLPKLFRRTTLPREYVSHVAVIQRRLINDLRTVHNEQNKHVNTYTERSHTCGQITLYDIGKRVTLFGWVKQTRFDNKIIMLRDSYGVAQCIVGKNLLTKSFRRTKLPNESVIQVTGVVQRRLGKHDLGNGQLQQDDRPLQISSDGVEILVDSINLLSLAKKDLPILARENQEHTLSNRLTYRYLDLRSSRMQESLRFRSKMTNILRNSLINLNFVECETPTLFKRTPGGANEFVVPTQLANKFYSLTQSPQQLKQLLMVGALDRYFQICRCYRDESGRSDRQPEFTQLDIELSFTNQQLVMKLINEIVYHLFSEIASTDSRFQSLLSCFETDRNVKVLSYHEALNRFGTDKPDTRFEWEIETLQSGGCKINIPFKLDELEIMQLVKSFKIERNLEEISLNNIIIKCHESPYFNTEIISSDRSKGARMLLGELRQHIARKLERLGSKVYQSRFDLLWVVEFPLFSIDGKTGQLESNHHPFTAPTEETIEFLTTDPAKTIGQHYDLILNGQEIAGGSMRINDADLQNKILTDILKCKQEHFSYFIEALRSGCPPHGGIAFGLDRLVAILLGKNTIREVIAFPKSSIGRDLMSDCPHALENDAKELYHLK